MEELAKKVEQILGQFFVECQGNRLNQWAWVPLRDLILKTIKDYKPVKNEVAKDAKK